MSDKAASQLPTPGDSITVGDLSNVKGVAIGRGASATVNESGAASLNEIAQAFAKITQAVNGMPEGPSKTIAQQAVQGLQTEAKKGDQANEKSVGDWFNFLAQTAPDAFEVAIATFANPIVGLGLAFKKIADRAKQDKDQASAKTHP